MWAERLSTWRSGWGIAPWWWMIALLFSLAPDLLLGVFTDDPAVLALGRPLLLDGATGTELERAGLNTGLPLWSSHALLEAPDAVLEALDAWLPQFA